MVCYKTLPSHMFNVHILTRDRRIFTGRANRPDTTPPTVPVRTPEFLPSRTTSQLRTTWLGHACFLVDFPGGLRVLFDPVFTERCSPFSWLGPKRYTKMPCQVEDIPNIDAVVISHNHYGKSLSRCFSPNSLSETDHMSHPTMTKIKSLHPNAHFFVPLGNLKWCLDSGIQNATELDWWEERDLTLSAGASSLKSGSTTIPDITARISCLPCQHTSARTPFDKGMTLWASWAVESGGKKVWFGGYAPILTFWLP